MHSIRIEKYLFNGIKNNKVVIPAQKKTTKVIICAEDELNNTIIPKIPIN